MYYYPVQSLLANIALTFDYPHLNRLVIAGGVSANSALREKLAVTTKKLGGSVFYPRPEFCTDNGAMIAYAGLQRLKAGTDADLTFKANPRWPLDSLPSVKS